MTLFRRCLPFVLALWAMAAQAQPVLVADLDWSEPVEGFGGWSGLALHDAGRRFVAISDRGRIVEGRILRDAAGTPTGLAPERWDWLRNTEGQRMNRGRSDAEGLARRADGRLYVSFEGDHRVWTYPGIGTGAAWLQRPDAFRAFQGNSGMEGLALDARGWLYTLPERSGATDRPFLVWRWRGASGWDQPFSIPREGLFLPTGLDIGPDGKLYLLERALVAFAFRTRVRRFTLTGTAIGEAETVLETSAGRHGNLEGLSVWRDGTGAIRLTMIADDNFRSFQSTELVEYRLAR